MTIDWPTDHPLTRDEFVTLAMRAHADGFPFCCLSCARGLQYREKCTCNKQGAWKGQLAEGPTVPTKKEHP